MEHDEIKVDEVVLALLFLNSYQEYNALRAWKSFGWDSLNRLHEKGYIGNPKSKAKSVIFTEEGRILAEELFKKHLQKPESS